MKNLDLIWQNTLAELKLQLSAPVFKTLFGKAKLVKINRPRATIATNSAYINDLIQKRYQEPLQQALKNQLGWQPQLVLTVSQEPTPGTDGPLFQTAAPKKTAPPTHYDSRTGLHPRFTFANFVVGNANNFAYAAAQGIIKNPGFAYNPFFVWGGVGVGKTHLIQAIGHELLRQNPNLRLRYVSAETFTNDLVQAIRSKEIGRFKQKYRQLDTLIIDDIQFISGKEYVQEEIFHTFNNLYIANKQIILSSDRRPEEIPKLEDRLSSRFMGGLTVDIQPPDYEMRVAILHQRAETLGIEIPQEAISFIAETVETNIRELEGFLTQISALAKSQKKKIDLAMVREFFGLKKARSSRRPNYRHLLSVVAKTFRVKTSDIQGKARRKDIALARHVAAYLLRKELEMPLERVGQILGGRDHTTIMHAENKISRLFSTNQQLRHQIIAIQKEL